jgi:hypothetical protein
MYILFENNTTIKILIKYYYQYNFNHHHCCYCYWYFCYFIAIVITAVATVDAAVFNSGPTHITMTYTSSRAVDTADTTEMLSAPGMSPLKNMHHA